MAILYISGYKVYIIRVWAGDDMMQADITTFTGFTAWLLLPPLLFDHLSNEENGESENKLITTQMQTIATYCM